MPSNDLRPIARTARPPLHPLLAQFVVAFFVAALFTDLTYWQTADMMWANFSAWLISAGVVIGYVAVIVGLFDLLTKRSAGLPTPVWPWVIADLVVLALGTINMFIHSRDAWTSVVPWGLTLSAAVTVILLFAGWTRRDSAYRNGLGETA